MLSRVLVVTELVVVLSLGYAVLTVITEAIGLPKLSLFCNVQRDVVSLPSYSKTEFKFKSCDTYLVTDWLLIIMHTIT